MLGAVYFMFNAWLSPYLLTHSLYGRHHTP